MNLETLQELWKEDCKINLPLDEASSETPKLHAKYLEFFNLAKFQLKRADQDQKILLKEKWLYYFETLHRDIFIIF